MITTCDRPTLVLSARSKRCHRVCIICGIGFLSHKATVRTCGHTCRRRWNRLTDEERSELIEALTNHADETTHTASLLVAR